MKAQRPYDDNPCKPRHFKPPPCAPVALDEPAQQTLEVGRTRLLVTAGLFAVAFAVIALRLVDVTLVKPSGETRVARNHVAGRVEVSRADIVDRNGVLLATTLASPSLYANPKQILDAVESVGGVEYYLMEQEGSRFSELETAQRCLATWRKLRGGR